MRFRPNYAILVVFLMELNLSDLTLVVLVFIVAWLAMEIGGGGGGHRARVPVPY